MHSFRDCLPGTETLSDTLFAIAGTDFSASDLAPGKFERQFRVHDDLTAYLRDGPVDFSILFDTVGSRDTASEKFGDSPDAVDMFFRRSNYVRLSLRLLSAVLLEREKLFALSLRRIRIFFDQFSIAQQPKVAGFFVCRGVGQRIGRGLAVCSCMRKYYGSSEVVPLAEVGVQNRPFASIQAIQDSQEHRIFAG